MTIFSEFDEDILFPSSDGKPMADNLEKEPRTYNSVQLARKLKIERAVNLSSDCLRRLL